MGQSRTKPSLSNCATMPDTYNTPVTLALVACFVPGHAAAAVPSVESGITFLDPAISAVGYIAPATPIFCCCYAFDSFAKPSFRGEMLSTAKTSLQRLILSVPQGGALSVRDDTKVARSTARAT